MPVMPEDKPENAAPVAQEAQKPKEAEPVMEEVQEPEVSTGEAPEEKADGAEPQE